jgi:hypothetical protein
MVYDAVIAKKSSRTTKFESLLVIGNYREV